MYSAPHTSRPSVTDLVSAPVKTPKTILVLPLAITSIQSWLYSYVVVDLVVYVSPNKFWPYVSDFTTLAKARLFMKMYSVVEVVV